MKEVIHIGFSKSASTFLQSLFENNAEVNFIYKSKRFSLLDEDKEEVDLNESLTNLESDEHIVLPSYNKDLNVRTTKLEDVKKILDRIYNHNSEAKIILVLRSQLGLLPSRYSQYIVSGGDKSLSDFFSILNGLETNKKDHFQNYYCQIVKMIVDLFGKENTLILFFEEINSNRVESIKRISEFLNVNLVPKRSTIFSRRKGLTKNGIKMVRFINTYLVKSNENYHGVFETHIPIFFYKNLIRTVRLIDYFLPKTKEKLTSEEVKMIAEKFKEDNFKLSEYLNKDIRSLGYL